MKKLIAILLVAMLVLSAFAACGKKNAAPATDATNPDGTPVETTEGAETTDPTTATEADQETEPQDNTVVDIDTTEDSKEEDSNDENAVINFDDLLDAAN